MPPEAETSFNIRRAPGRGAKALTTTALINNYPVLLADKSPHVEPHALAIAIISWRSPLFSGDRQKKMAIARIPGDRQEGLKRVTLRKQWYH